MGSEISKVNVVNHGNESIDIFTYWCDNNGQIPDEKYLNVNTRRRVTCECNDGRECDLRICRKGYKTTFGTWHCRDAYFGFYLGNVDHDMYVHVFSDGTYERMQTDTLATFFVVKDNLRDDQKANITISSKDDRFLAKTYTDVSDTGEMMYCETLSENDYCNVQVQWGDYYDQYYQVYQGECLAIQGERGGLSVTIEKDCPIEISIGSVNFDIPGWN